MNKKKQLVFFLFFSLFLVQLSGFATATVLDEVAVNYQGSWQWFVPEYGQPMLKQGAGGKSIDVKFDLDLDDADERVVVVSYLGQNYMITAERSPLGGRWVNFTVQKNGQGCGNKAISLPILSNEVADLSRECGIQIWANWETIVFHAETDVAIEKILISTEEINKVQNEYFVKRNRAEFEKVAKYMQNVNYFIRAIDKTTDFSEGEKYFIYGHTEYFDEEDTTGKTKSIIITDNLEVKYVIMVPEQASTEFKVYKPTQKMQLSSSMTITNFEALIKKVHSSEMQQIPVKENNGILKDITAGLATGLSVNIFSPARSVAAYIAINGARTHTVVTDPQELIFNWDREYVSWSSEGKINFILLTKDIGGPAPPVTPPSGVTTGAVFIEFTSFPEGKSTSDVKVTVRNVADDTVVSVTAKWVGNKLIVYGLEAGKEYKITLDLAGNPLLYTIKAREFDKCSLERLPPEAVCPPPATTPPATTPPATTPPAAPPAGGLV